jgi:hypothetical protein
MQSSKVSAGSFDLRTAALESAQDLGKGLSAVVATAVTGFVSHKMLNQLFSKHESANENPAAIAIANAFVATMTATLTGIMVKWAKTRLSPTDAMKMTYQRHIALTKNALARRPEDVRRAVSKLDSEISEILKRSEPGVSKEATIREYLDARCFLMKLPTEEHVTPGSRTYFTAEEQNAYREGLDKLVGDFPDSVRGELRNYVSALGAGQNLPALFVGEGGTGKTHFAKRLAELLGVPFLQLQSKGGFKVGPVSGSYYYAEPGKAPPIRGDNIGVLAPMLADESGVLNPILLLDEAKFGLPEMNSLKMMIQEGSLAPFNLKPYNIAIDPSKIRIIIASNDKPSDAAFTSRLKVFQFPQVTDSLKAKLGAAAVTKRAQEYVDDFVADEDVVNLAREMTYQAVARLVEGDGSPGVRESSRMLTELFSFIVSTLRDQIPAGQEVDTEEIRSSIQQQLDGKIERMQEDAALTEQMVNDAKKERKNPPFMPYFGDSE